MSKIIPKKYSVEDLFCSKARTKVIRTLALNEELNISKIMKNTNLNHSTLVTHLQFFVKIGLVQEKIFGRIKIYRYKNENIIAHCLSNFIKLLEGED